MLLRNGISLDQAIRTVDELAMACGNLRSELSGGGDPWRKYVDWAATCERQLRSLFADPGLIEGLHTQRYWHIWVPGTHWGKLIAAEINVQVERLESIAARLRSYLSLRQRPGHLAVVDTNVLLHYQRVDKVKWGDVLKEHPVRLVIPHIVLDELDDKRYLGSATIRKTARSAIAPFEELREQLEGQGYATLLVGQATVEYLVDEESHVRRENPDEEVVDRARFLQQVTGRTVTMITADLGMRARAVARGLPVAEMPDTLKRDQDDDQ
jgi:rRNA-processing protein FCF1